MFFPALPTPALPPLALLTKINSCFHLFQCISHSAPASGKFCSASLQGCRGSGITSHSQYTCWTLIHLPSHPRFALRTKARLLRAWTKGVLALTSSPYKMTDVSSNRVFDTLYERQIVITTDMNNIPERNTMSFLMRTYLCIKMENKLRAWWMCEMETVGKHASLLLLHFSASLILWCQTKTPRDYLFALLRTEAITKNRLNENIREWLISRSSRATDCRGRGVLTHVS